MNTQTKGRTRTAALTLAVLAMMMGGFLFVLPNIPAAHANPSVVQHKSADTGTGCNCPETLAYASPVAAGDVLVFAYQCSPTASNGGCALNGVLSSDTQGNTWTQIGVNSFGCVTGASCGVEYYYTIAASSSADTIHYQGSNSLYLVDEYAALYEINPNGNTPTYGVVTGNAAVAATSFSVSAQSTSFSAFVIEGLSLATSGTIGISAGFSNAGSCSGYDCSAFVSSPSSNTTSCPMTTTASSKAALDCFVMEFGAATTTVATTITLSTSTVCGGDCTGSGSASWLPNGTEWATYTQNPVPATGTVSNVTVKLAAAPATTSGSPTITVGVFVTCNPNYTPSPSNYLQTVDEVAFTLTNGTLTDNGYLHIPLSQLVVSTSGSCLASGAPITVCGFCYFGVGVISTNHASRGGGATGSGFDIQQATGGSAWWSWLPFFGLFGLAWDGSGSTIANSYLGYAVLTIAGQVITVGGGTTTYTTITNTITDVTSTTTQPVPVSNCFGCGASFGQALTFAVMGLGVSQGVANWLLTLGCLFLFVALGGMLTKWDPQIMALAAIGALGIATGLGFLFWLYFAVMMILGGVFGTGRALHAW